MWKHRSRKITGQELRKAVIRDDRPRSFQWHTKIQMLEDPHSKEKCLVVSMSKRGTSWIQNWRQTTWTTLLIIITIIPLVARLWPRNQQQSGLGKSRTMSELFQQSPPRRPLSIEMPKNSAFVSSKKYLPNLTIYSKFIIMTKSLRNVLDTTISGY